MIPAGNPTIKETAMSDQQETPETPDPSPAVETGDVQGDINVTPPAEPEPGDEPSGE